MTRKQAFGALLLASMVLGPSRAQVAKPAATPTPGRTAEGDPWQRWVREYYQVVAVPRGTEMRLGGNLARPHPRVNAVMEIVWEDEQFVYLRNLPLEDPRSAGHKAWLLRQGRELQQEERREFFAGEYLIAREPLLPPRIIRKLRFADQSGGLPQAGLWQMGFAWADMDGDGVRDLVVPPARKGEPHPWIFLRKDERWIPWGAARWPEGPAYDYGDVKVADFDGDGHLDLALACHFKPSYVLYGDGQGGFSRWVQLPQANGSVTSRALAVADFNRDGRPDIVTLAELDLDLGTNQAITSGLVNVVLNTEEGWKLSPATFPRGVYGDHVAVGDFDGDGSPDILTASHKGGNELYVFLNEGHGQAFTPYRSRALPIQSFVLGVAAGSLDGKKPDQVVLAVYQSLRPKEGEHSYAHALLAYRLAKRRGKLLSTPERTVIYADQQEPINSFRDVAVGDLDGDGRQDLVALRASGAIQVLLQLPDGGFALEQTELGIPGSSPSSVAVVKEKGGTYIVANFSDDKEQRGGLRVWKVAGR